MRTRACLLQTQMLEDDLDMSFPSASFEAESFVCLCGKYYRPANLPVLLSPVPILPESWDYRHLGILTQVLRLARSNHLYLLSPLSDTVIYFFDLSCHAALAVLEPVI